MLLAADGEDGNGLQLEKVGPTFSSSTVMSLRTSYGLLLLRDFT